MTRGMPSGKVVFPTSRAQLSQATIRPRMIRIFRHYVSGVFLSLFLTEIALFFTVFHAGSLLRSYLKTQELLISSGLGVPATVFCLSMLFSATATGLYQRFRSIGPADLLLRIFASVALNWMVLNLLFNLLPALYEWRQLVHYASGLAFFSMLVSRTVFLKFADSSSIKRRLLVLGTGQRANMIYEFEQRSKCPRFRVLGYVRLEREQQCRVRGQVLEASCPLTELAARLDVDEIVNAPDDRGDFRLLDEILDCKMDGLQILDFLSFFEREAGLLRVDCLDAHWLVFSDGFRIHGGAALLKRLSDIFWSLLLLAFAWPVMLLAALAILMEDGLGSSVFYRQVRVGLRGKPFVVIKFRSMSMDAEKDGKAHWACPNDYRVTRVGRFIRKFRIDELPQLLNVLRGEMSFVGPRPERPEFVEQFAETIPYYKERHRVKPGITGWAQLCYVYGSSHKDAVEKLQFDLYYVKNYSFFLDMLIILQTVELVLWGRGL